MTDESTKQQDEAVAAAADEAAATVEAGEAVPEQPQPQDKPAKRGRPRKGGGGFELVLTVRGSDDATDWSADVTQGGKKVLTGLAVPASSVSAAAKDLHPQIAEAIDGVLSAARDRQRSRVEQLQAELEAAQRALADLQD